MKQAERLSAVIQLSPLEILNVLLKNINILLRTRNYTYARNYLERIYEEYGNNLGITHKQTLEYFKSLMDMYFSLPRTERRNAIDFILLLVKISGELFDAFSKDQGQLTDIKVIRAMSVAFNEIAFYKYLPEQNWDDAELYFKRALDFMKKCGEEDEIANMKINVQLVYFWSGSKVDIKTLEEAKEILLRKNDNRAFKASLIIRSLYEKDSKPKYNVNLLLNLCFAVALSDGKIDSMEVDMMKRILDPKRVDSFSAEVTSLLEAYSWKPGPVIELLIKNAVKLTNENKYSQEEIKKIIHEVIFIAIADLSILQSEMETFCLYGRHFNLSPEEINKLFMEFL
jgi:hypothetical protein